MLTCKRSKAAAVRPATAIAKRAPGLPRWPRCRIFNHELFRSFTSDLVCRQPYRDTFSGNPSDACCHRLRLSQIVTSFRMQFTEARRAGARLKSKESRFFLVGADKGALVDKTRRRWQRFRIVISSMALEASGGDPYLKPAAGIGTR